MPGAKHIAFENWWAPSEYLLTEYCSSLGEATVEIQTQAGGATKVESRIVGKA